MDMLVSCVMKQALGILNVWRYLPDYGEFDAVWCLKTAAVLLMLLFFWQLIYSWRASITTVSSPMVTFPFLANRTRTISKRPWKPWILWASPMRKSYVSIHETNTPLLNCLFTYICLLVNYRKHMLPFPCKEL